MKKSLLLTLLRITPADYYRKRFVKECVATPPTQGYVVGTQRIGTLPNTERWRRVIRLIADDADVTDVATATTEAALDGFRKVRKDEGMAYTYFLLARLACCARDEDSVAALRGEGLVLSDQPDLFELAAAFTEAVDLHLQCRHQRTDLGEMAQLAGIEALTDRLHQQSASLFGTTPAEVRVAVQRLSTETGFGLLTHLYFARFTQRFLTYHLGRELSHHVGGNGRFADPVEHNEFLRRLNIHCWEAAAILRDYAGGWYSKALAPGHSGITRSEVARFLGYSLTKLHGELQRRGARDG